MVHRPSDSRLLVNLLNHEKEYSKQLANLLDHSQASLTSLSAYASASSPPTSHIIVAVVGAFYGADEALRSYASAVDQWQQQLKALKEMEEGLGNIMRDREILVTRLIKASKNSKPPPRDPLPKSGSSSTLSFSIKPEVQLGSKLSAAQTELQACEAHLANKEKELEAFRIATIRSGLQARCQALVECAWTWGEMGKEGIKALSMFEAPNGNVNSMSLPPLPTLKPLPDLSQDRLGSDLSSIAPSQSASQIGSMVVDRPTSTQYTLSIPPAHSISDHAMPNGTVYRSKRQPEIDEPGGSSAEEGDAQQDVQIVENERFMPSRKRKGPVLAHVRTVSEAPPNKHVHFPSSNSDTFLLRSPTERELEKTKRGGSVSVRKGSGVFGSIAALFKGHKSSASVDGDSPTSVTGGRWKTRTDKNLKKVSKGGDSSDEEDLRLRQRLGPSVSAPIFQDASEAGPGPTTSRIMKKRLKRGSVQIPSKEQENNRGWMSENDGDTVRGRKAKLAHVINLDESERVASGSGHHRSSQPQSGNLSRSSSLKKPPAMKPDGELPLVTGTPVGASLSRNSSMSKQSVMSAPEPVRHPSISAVNLPSTSKSARRRTASLDNPIPTTIPSRSGPSANPGSGKVLSGLGYPPVRSSTIKTTTKRPAEASMNLMSIVEDVRKNRDMFAKQQDPDRMLMLPKAPPPASELMAWEEQREKEARQAEENMRSIAAASTPSEPPTPTTATTIISIPAEREEHRPEPVIHSPPDKGHTPKPLRSALRATSRSPSPSPVRSPPAQSVTSPKVAVTTKSPSPPPLANGSANGEMEPIIDDTDTASISSYETGQEVMDDEDQLPDLSPFASAPSPPPPPPAEDPARAVNSEVSQSTDSTVTDGGTAKRTKSVRMSLPPSFSATPPAIYGDPEMDGYHEPWSSPPTVPLKRRSRPPTKQDPAVVPNGHGGHTPKGGWSSRIPETVSHQDVWQDSDEEDAEYGAARRLLNKFTRKG